MPIDVNSDGSLLCAIAGRREHPVKLHSPFEQDGISWGKNSCTKRVELFLRVNMILLGQTWEALQSKYQKKGNKIILVVFGHRCTHLRTHVF